MISPDRVRELALSYEATAEAPHFENIAFKVKGKIFLTLNVPAGHITIRLSPADQSMFHTYQPGTVYPVPNKWGNHGWTHVNLQVVEDDLLRELIRLSYCLTAPAKLAARYSEPTE